MSKQPIRVKVTPKPDAKACSTARLFYADLTTCYLRGINQRLPVAGGRLIWAVVGHKHVRCCTPITNIKWRMKRSEWDQMPTSFYG